MLLHRHGCLKWVWWWVLNQLIGKSNFSIASLSTFSHAFWLNDRRRHWLCLSSCQISVLRLRHPVLAKHHITIVVLGDVVSESVMLD